LKNTMMLMGKKLAQWQQFILEKQTEIQTPSLCMPPLQPCHRKGTRGRRRSPCRRGCRACRAAFQRWADDVDADGGGGPPIFGGRRQRFIRARGGLREEVRVGDWRGSAKVGGVSVTRGWARRRTGSIDSMPFSLVRVFWSRTPCDGLRGRG
jgi:hypothetical protein